MFYITKNSTVQVIINHQLYIDGKAVIKINSCNWQGDPTSAALFIKHAKLVDN